MFCSVMLALMLALANAATVPKPSLLSPEMPSPVSNMTAMTNSSANTPYILHNILRYHVPNTNIDIYLRDTGDRLSLLYLSICLDRLGYEIIREITINGEHAFSTPQIFRYESVSVVFMPRDITWMDAGEVIDALEALVSRGGWTYASHITIVDMKKGTLGYLNFKYKAPGTPDEIASSDHMLSNLTSRPRPTSPYPYVIPGSHISIICATFGRHLHAQSVFALFFETELYIKAMLRVNGPLALIGGLKTWKLGDVVLTVDPGDKLRWFDLAVAVEGLVDFVSTFETFAFDFEIRYEGYRSLGFGKLRLKSDPETA
ncbi:MAG: hypothetical protein Q9213_002483 [Squamulea squamosa]